MELTELVELVEVAGPAGQHRGSAKPGGQIIRNERQARVAGNDGALHPVVDGWGRHALQLLIFDIQSTARSFDDQAQATVERAWAETVARLNGCPEALAIPTHAPLDAFNARTYLA